MSEKKDKPKNKGGRPRIPMETNDLKDFADKLPSKPFHLETVLYWMDLGATAEEIAGAHYVSVQTLDRRLKEITGQGFGELKKKVCGESKVALRRNQFKMSETNATMAIWLGKNWLGQKDMPEVFEEFNGKLASLFDMLNTLKTDADSIKPKTD